MLDLEQASFRSCASDLLLDIEAGKKIWRGIKKPSVGLEGG